MGTSNLLRISQKRHGRVVHTLTISRIYQLTTMEPRTKKQKIDPNVAQVANWTVVKQCQRRWKDGDVGKGTASCYLPKQKEFLTWVKANHPNVLSTPRQQKSIILENTLSDERKHVAELDLNKIIRCKFSIFKLFLTSKVRGKW